MGQALMDHAERNNVAVRWFQSGRYNESLESFAEALRNSISFLREQRTSCSLSSNVGETRMIVVLHDLPALSSSSREEIVVDATRVCNDPFLYGRPVELIVSVRQPSPAGTANAAEQQDQDEDTIHANESLLLAKVATTVIFNTALAYQVVGLTESNHTTTTTTTTTITTTSSRDTDDLASAAANRTHMIHKAKELYHLAYNMYGDHRRGGSEIQMMSQLTAMATCNNLGRCCSVLGLEEKARSFFQVLLQNIVLIQQQQQQQQQQQIQQHPFGYCYMLHQDCFCRNIVSLV
jgi:hypothetical protein